LLYYLQKRVRKNMKKFLVNTTVVSLSFLALINTSYASDPQPPPPAPVLNACGGTSADAAAYQAAIDKIKTLGPHQRAAKWGTIATGGMIFAGGIYFGVPQLIGAGAVTAGVGFGIGGVERVINDIHANVFSGDPEVERNLVAANQEDDNNKDLKHTLSKMHGMDKTQYTIPELKEALALAATSGDLCDQVTHRLMVRNQFREAVLARLQQIHQNQPAPAAQADNGAVAQNEKAAPVVGGGEAPEAQPVPPAAAPPEAFAPAQPLAPAQPVAIADNPN
jgi:hypothetical protein